MKHSNITTVFTTDVERNYGNVLIIDPPKQDAILTERFQNAEAKYPSNYLKHRKSDDDISRCFNNAGQFEHVKTPAIIAKEEIQTQKAPQAFFAAKKVPSAGSENKIQETPTNIFKK